VTIPPSCQAGDILMCTADSEPASQYYWILHHENDKIHYGQTYTLEPGLYNLTCVAYINMTCSGSSGSPNWCTDAGSYASKANNADFPYSLFMLPAIDYARTLMCNATAHSNGYAISE